MVSKPQESFLREVIAEDVSARDPFTDIEFSESRIDQLIRRSDADNSSSVRRFFQRFGYEICLNCGSMDSNCNCGSPDHEQAYYLDPDYIIREWADDVANLNLYEDVLIEENGITKVKAVTSEFGEIVFKMVTDIGDLAGVETGVSDREFAVSLVEDDQINEEDDYFMWYQLTSENTHEDLHSKIRETYSLLFQRVCDMDSGAATDNINAIQENIRIYLQSKGFEQVDVTRAAGGAGQVLEFNEVDFAAEDENGVVVICGCDKSGSDVHLHYIVDGDIQPVSDCEPADKVAELIRSKLKDVETLRQKAYEINGRARGAVAVGTALGLGTLVPYVTGLFNVAGLDLSNYPVSPEILIILFLFVGFVLLLWPSVKLSLVSWDVRPWYVRLRDRIPFSD